MTSAQSPRSLAEELRATLIANISLHNGPADSVMRRAAVTLDLAEKALDQIAYRVSVDAPWGQDVRAEIVSILRATGRTA